MFHVVTDKGEEYIIDNEGKLTASKMSGDLWERTYDFEYADAPQLPGTYSEISDRLYASDNIVDAVEFYPSEIKEISYSAFDLFRGNSDAIEDLLKDESLIDVLDNLKPLEILHLIKYLKSDEERKSLVEEAKNYVEWLVYGSNVLGSDPKGYIRHLKSMYGSISS